MVRAKFTCTSVTKRKGWNGVEFVYDAEFNVVYDDGVAEHKEFFAATPAGKITLSTLKADHFVVGQHYYVDFTPA